MTLWISQQPKEKPVNSTAVSRDKANELLAEPSEQQHLEKGHTDSRTWETHGATLSKHQEWKEIPKAAKKQLSASPHPQPLSASGGHAQRVAKSGKEDPKVPPEA